MKKHEFKKGDRVVCVDNVYVKDYLILNQIYVVERVNYDYNKYNKILSLFLVDFEQGFFAYRFEIAEKRIIEYL